MTEHTIHIEGQNRGISRRRFLAGAGLVITAAAGGGILYRAADNGVFSVGQGVAYAPWSDLDDLTGTPVDLVYYAILASNAHNTQPWLFHVTENRSDFSDPRNLPTNTRGAVGATSQREEQGK